MALGTPNSQAIDIANKLVDLGQKLVQAKHFIDQYSSQYTQLAMGTTFGAMGTLEVNPDGTVGSPDSSPVATNPLDPSRYPAIRRLISANDVGSLLTLLQAVSGLLAGQPVSQQGQSPQLLAKLYGGEEEIGA